MADLTTPDSHDPKDQNYDSFLDDPFNMAMYVVLPAMIVVYGGCCVIYCVAKLRRYIRRRNKRRVKKQLIEKDGGGDDEEGEDDKKDVDNNNRPKVDRKSQKNTSHDTQESAISVVDLTDNPTLTPITTTRTTAGGKTAKPVTVKSAATAAKFSRPSARVSTKDTLAQSRPTPPPKPFKHGLAQHRATGPWFNKPNSSNAAAAAAASAAVAAGSAVSSTSGGATNNTNTTTIASESWAVSQGVEPGYKQRKPYNTDVQQQMQHLDDQLKAAFRLITCDSSKEAKSRPDVCARSDENSKPIAKRSGVAHKMHFFTSDQ